MSRASLTRLCHDAVRACASLCVSSRTASNGKSVKAAVASNKTTTKDTKGANFASAGPMGSVAGTSSSFTGSTPSIVPESLSATGEHLLNTTFTFPEDETSLKQPSMQRKTNPLPSFNFDKARPFSAIPGPTDMPIIGTTWVHMPMGPLYGLKLDAKMNRLQELFGNIVKERVMGRSLLHVFDPADMETVYRSDGMTPRRDIFRMLTKYHNEHGKGVNGLITSQGDTWYKLRSRSQVMLMRPQSVSDYTELQGTVFTDLVANIEWMRNKDGVVEDLLPVLCRATMEGICCVVFNRRIGALAKDIKPGSDPHKLIEAVDTVLEASQSETRKMYIFSASPTFRKLVGAMNFMKHLTRQEVRKTMHMISCGDESMKGNFLSHMMTTAGLSEEEVLTTMTELFAGGVDTTGVTIGFGLYYLSRHPEVQDKLRKEIDEHIGKSEVISANTIHNMPYLRAYLKETLRYYGVAPGNTRTSTRDIVLSGYHIPAGTWFHMHNTWAARNPKYIKNPEKFLPERWLRGKNAEYLDMNAFVFTPFGFGPRMCVGKRFAEQEFYLAIAKILQKYRVEWAYHTRQTLMQS